MNSRHNALWGRVIQDCAFRQLIHSNVFFQEACKIARPEETSPARGRRRTGEMTVNSFPSLWYLPWIDDSYSRRHEISNVASY
jgi:hypothetical protein